MTDTLRHKKVAIFLDHSGHGDTRILAQLSALRNAGATVRLFSLNRTHFGDRRDPLKLAGVETVQVQLDDSRIVPFLHRLQRNASPQETENRSAHDAKTSQPDGTQETQPPANPRARERERPTNTKPKAAHWKARINRTLGALFWHRSVSRVFALPVDNFQPDLIIANDLSMLGVGVHCAERTRAKLLYDSHEYEAGRNNVEPTLAEAVRVAHQHYLIRRADGIMTVGVAIAILLQRDHNLPDRPAVIVNAAEELQNVAQRNPRAHQTPVALYTGSIVQGRGLDMCMEAVQDRKGILDFAVLANLSEAERHRLYAHADTLAITSHFEVWPSVSPSEVPYEIAKADLSVIPVQDSSTSYRYCVPNKLFQSFSARTPVVATPLPEVKAILRVVGGGTSAVDFSASSFAQAIDDALDHTPSYDDTALDAYSRRATDQALVTIVAGLLKDGTCPDLPPLPHEREMDVEQDCLVKVPTGLSLWKSTVAHVLLGLSRPFRKA